MAKTYRPRTDHAAALHAHSAALFSRVIDGTGLTPYRLGELAGVQREGLYKLMKGQILPNLETVLRLCKTAGVSLAVFDGLMKYVDAEKVTENKGGKK